MHLWVVFYLVGVAWSTGICVALLRSSEKFRDRFPSKAMQVGACAGFVLVVVFWPIFLLVILAYALKLLKDSQRSS